MPKYNFLLRDLADRISKATGLAYNDTVLMLQDYFGHDCVRIAAENFAVSVPALEGNRAALTPMQLAEFILNEMKGWEFTDSLTSYTAEGLAGLLDAIHLGNPIKWTETRVTAAAASPMAQQVGGTHYKGDKIQHFTLCMEDNIPWGESSAIKYLMRHRKKNGLQDLLKALHYVEMTIEHYHPGELEKHRNGRDVQP